MYSAGTISNIVESKERTIGRLVLLSPTFQGGGSLNAQRKEGCLVDSVGVGGEGVIRVGTIGWWMESMYGMMMVRHAGGLGAKVIPNKVNGGCFKYRSCGLRSPLVRRYILRHKSGRIYQVYRFSVYLPIFVQSRPTISPSVYTTLSGAD